MWEKTLESIVAFYESAGAKPDPAFLYNAKPSAKLPWPSAVPASDSIRSFYARCDGGEFGPMIRFIATEKVEEETNRWIELLRNYDARGDVLSPRRHLVFANDADGTPWIYDDVTKAVASFYWKGGGWCEPRYPSFDDFMADILSPKADDPDWANTLRMIQDSVS